MVDKVSNYLLDHFLYRGETVEGNEREIMLFGIMGEYLGRIFNETKNRPLYLKQI